MNREVIDLTMDDMPVCNLKLSFEMVNGLLVEMGDCRDMDTEIDEMDMEVDDDDPFSANQNVLVHVPLSADPFQDRRMRRIKVNIIGEMYTHNKECPLCNTDTVEENRCVASCAHAFCIPCLNNWEDDLIAKSNHLYRKNVSCPVCHQYIDDIIEFSSENNDSVIKFSSRGTI